MRLDQVMEVLKTNIAGILDDLAYILNSPNTWISAYVVKENKRFICHCAAWKTKQEALVFAMNSPYSRRDYVFNRLD